jgi:hypothetical protein
MGNPVVHFELIGPDPAALRDFYSQLFGWNEPPGAPVAEAVSATSEYSFIPPTEQAPAAAGGIGGGPGYDSHAVTARGSSDGALLALFDAIATNDRTRARRTLDSSPNLASLPIHVAASRANADTFFISAIRHCVYAGDTALHIAAASYQRELVEFLVTKRGRGECSQPPRSRTSALRSRRRSRPSGS